MRLDEVMRGRDVVQVGPQDSVIATAGLMRDRGVASAFVVDEHGLVGILTERDLVHKIVAEGRSPADLRVVECMTDAVEPRGTHDVIRGIEESSREQVFEVPATVGGADLADVIPAWY